MEEQTPAAECIRDDERPFKQQGLYLQSPSLTIGDGGDRELVPDPLIHLDPFPSDIQHVEAMAVITCVCAAGVLQQETTTGCTLIVPYAT